MHVQSCAFYRCMHQTAVIGYGALMEVTSFSSSTAAEELEKAGVSAILILVAVLKGE